MQLTEEGMVLCCNCSGRDNNIYKLDLVFSFFHNIFLNETSEEQSMLCTAK